jgi:hypothetical protein
MTRWGRFAVGQPSRAHPPRSQEPVVGDGGFRGALVQPREPTLDELARQAYLDARRSPRTPSVLDDLPLSVRAVIPRPSADDRIREQGRQLRHRDVGERQVTVPARVVVALVAGLKKGAWR